MPRAEYGPTPTVSLGMPVPLAMCLSHCSCQLMKDRVNELERKLADAMARAESSAAVSVL